MTWDPVRAIEGELQPGEVVRWAGRPSFLPVLRSETLTIFIGLVFAAIPIVGASDGWIVWIESGLEPKDEIFGLAVYSLLSIFGLAFAASGLLEVFGVWRTVYAVTNKRILVVKTFLWRRVLAITPGGVNAVEWRENNDGSGSFTFRREVQDHGDGKSTTTFGFIGTQDLRGAVREIEKLRGGEA